MNESIPSPYDITDIPYFPSSPGMIAWSAAIVAVTLLWFLARSRSRQMRSAPPALDKERLKREISNFKGLSAPQKVMALGPLSLLLRRFLTAACGFPFDASAPREIASALDRDELAPLRGLGGVLVKIEEVRFSPHAKSVEEFDRLLDQVEQEVSKLAPVKNLRVSDRE